MLRCLNNRRAQAVIGEYTLVIFLVLGVITAMTVYFKRGVQARIHDARDYMVNDVIARTAGVYHGNLYLHYEPYYINTDARVARSSNTTTRLFQGGPPGTPIFQKLISETTRVLVNSETAPPKDHALTTPSN